MTGIEADASSAGSSPRLDVGRPSWDARWGPQPQVQQPPASGVEATTLAEPAARPLTGVAARQQVATALPSGLDALSPFDSYVASVRDITSERVPRLPLPVVGDAGPSVPPHRIHTPLAPQGGAEGAEPTARPVAAPIAVPPDLQATIVQPSPALRARGLGPWGTGGAWGAASVGAASAIAAPLLRGDRVELPPVEAAVESVPAAWAASKSSESHASAMRARLLNRVTELQRRFERQDARSGDPADLRRDAAALRREAARWSLAAAGARRARRVNPRRLDALHYGSGLLWAQAVDAFRYRPRLRRSAYAGRPLSLEWTCG